MPPQTPPPAPIPRPCPRLKRPRAVLRVDPERMIGPGKADLLQAVEREGSISAAARALGMSYRRAWLLLAELQAVFGAPLVETATGGARGGGARMNDLGREVLAAYLELERVCAAAAAAPLARLRELVRSPEQG